MLEASSSSSFKLLKLQAPQASSSSSFKLQASSSFKLPQASSFLKLQASSSFKLPQASSFLKLQASSSHLETSNKVTSVQASSYLKQA
jgi:hypothetical protein